MDMASNRTASIHDLIVAGINVDNTSLQDKQTYQNDQWVQEQFKNKYGEFDQASFDTFYDNVKIQYNSLANAKYDESLKKASSFHRDNPFAPIEQKRKGPDYITYNAPNPYQITQSIQDLGRDGQRTKSIDEIAQGYKVLLNPKSAGEDLSNAQWGDSPNDGHYFFDTLVLAQYDSKDTHTDPFTGQEVEHNVGDLKTDNDGNFYYERLDGRNVYGRRVLNKLNVLTVDGSWLNKYDFFDSDDLNQKSLGGSIAKNLVLVGSMFIPYVGPWIAGLSIATQSAGLLATLGKMFINSESETLSNIEGWSKSVSRQGAQTEYAQQNTWCTENFVNLIGDVVGQLKEQRFIFEKIPAVFKGTNVLSEAGQKAKYAKLLEKQSKLSADKIEKLKSTKIELNDIVNLRAAETVKAQAELDSFIKGYTKLGSVLSKGYMTAITVGDTYGEAINSGASNIDATILTLGYAAAEYALLSTGLGEWIMPELRAGKYKAQAIAKALTQNNVTSNEIAQEGKKAYFKKLFNIGKNIAKAEYANGTRTATATLASAVGEGVEEVSEELLADFSKGCYDTVNWLRGNDTRVNTFGYNFGTGEWNPSEVLDRYGMSLVGGFAGGGLTNLGTNYKTIKSLNNMSYDTALQQLTYIIRNGQAETFLKQINKIQLANPHLSTKYEIIDGQPVYSPGTKEDNQDIAAKTILANQIKVIGGILQSHGAMSDNQFLDIQTLKDLRFSALVNSSIAGRYLQRYNSLLEKQVQLVTSLNDTIRSVKDTNGDNTVSDKENRENKSVNNEVISSLKQQIKDTQEEIDSLINGEKSYDFIADALFELTPAISKVFLVTTFPLYAEQKYKKKFSELTENEKAAALTEYKTWKSSEAKDDIAKVANIYRQMAEASSSVILKFANEYTKIPEDILKLNKVISNLYTYVVDENQQLQYLPNIKDSTFLDLASTATEGTFVNLGTKLVELLGWQGDYRELQEIQKRYNDIDKNAENSKELQDAISKEYANKLESILIDSIDFMVNPIFKQGYASIELKNQLTSLLKILHSRALSKATEFEDNRTFDNFDAENPYEIKASNILDSMRKIDNLPNTPIEQSLDEFSVAIGNEPIKLSQLIQRLNNSFNDTINDIQNFQLSEELYTELNNAIYTLQLYQAAIQGARTDNASINNLFGYNATLNEIAKKVKGEHPQLAEIDKSVADIFDQDIQTNLNKLTFLKNLYEINSGQKMIKQDRVAANTSVLLYKRLKHIISILDEDELKNWDGFLEFADAINSMNQHQQLLDNKSIIPNNWDEFEKERISAEDAIYTFFSKNKAKLSDPNALMQLINPNRLQLYTNANDILTEGLESLDDNSFIWWLASRAAVKSSDFYNEYKQIIDPKADHPIAPIPTQELATYLNYASIVNGTVFTQFYNAYRQAVVQDWNNKSIEDRKKVLRNLGKSETLADDKFAKYAINFLTAPRYQNIILTEGIPGSGKTSAVFHSTIALLKKFHPELLKDVAVMHGASKSSAEKIVDSLGITATVYDRASGMKSINTNWHDYKFDDKTLTYTVPDAEYEITRENEIRSNLGINALQNPPSLILIDEISKFSAYDLDQIDKFAQKYGITVLAAGDFDQTGIVGSHSLKDPVFNKIQWKIDLSRTNFIRAPKLGVSMRTDNSIKTLNLEKVQAYIKSPSPVQLQYYEDETGLYGDKILKYEGNKQSVLEETLKEVDKLIQTLQKGEKIGYIYSNKSSPIYQELTKDKYKDFIDLKEGGSAQGLEGRYYIIEANENLPAELLYRDIYTGISRASQGSILIAPLTNDLQLSSVQVSEKIDESKKIEQSIRNYSTKRINRLNTIVTSDNPVPYIPRKIPNTQNNSWQAPPPIDELSQEEIDKYIDQLNNIHTQRDLDTWVSTLDQKVLSTPVISQAIAQRKQILPKGFDPNQVTSILQSIEKATTVQELKDVVDKIDSEYLEEPNIKATLEAKRRSFLNSDNWQDRHDALMENNNHVPDIIGEVSELDEGIAINGQWFLPGDIITDKEGNQFNVTIVFKNGDVNITVPNTSDTKTLSKDEVAKFFTGEDPIILKNSRLGDAREKQTVPPTVPIVEIENDPTILTVINSTQYEEQIDDHNKSKKTPQSTAQTNNNPRISLNMLIHSFNTFETGVEVDESGFPHHIGGADNRIDSVNGLMKLFPNLTIDKYMSMIGMLRTILFNTSDKSEMIQSLQDFLKLNGIYVTFALKTSPRAGEKNVKEGRLYVSTNPTPMDKSINEKTFYNGSLDKRSQEFNIHSLVAIIGNQELGNVLELPLLTLSSPFTLLQVKNADGVQVFEKIYNKYTKLLEQTDSLHQICRQLIEEFDGIEEYQSLINLFKFFDFTMAGVFYVDDNQWTPMNDLSLLGPQFITEAGYYQFAPGLKMDEETNPESTWLNLGDYAKGVILGRPETSKLLSNPQAYVTSKVLVSTMDIDGVNTGHPFVLISFDKKNLNTDASVIEYYQRQVKGEVPVKVIRAYVLPPHATIREYVNNLHDIITQSPDKIQIGNIFTSYNLLNILMQNEAFKARLEQKLPGASTLVQQALSDLNGKSQKEQKNLLSCTRDWSSIGLDPTYTLTKLLDGIITFITYDNYTLQGDKHMKLNESDLSLIEGILASNGIDRVYYHVGLAGPDQNFGVFAVAKQEDGYLLHGRPFKIHGKIDSYTFQGNLDWLIESALHKLRTNKENGQVYSIDRLSYARKDESGRLVPGNSRISENPEQKAVRAIMSFLKYKVGNDFKEIFDTSSTVQEAIGKIVQKINRDYPNKVAIGLKDSSKILIADTDQYNITSLENENGEITDVSEMTNNNDGTYTFFVRADGMLLTANFDYQNWKLSYLQPTSQQSPKPTLSVTEDNFNEYVNLGRQVLEDSFDFDPDLEQVFQKDNYIEFMQALDALIYIDGNMRVDYLTELLNSATDEQTKQLLTDLISMEKYNDPNIESDSCPIEINIKF